MRFKSFSRDASGGRVTRIIRYRFMYASSGKYNRHNILVILKGNRILAYACQIELREQKDTCFMNTKKSPSGSCFCLA